MGISLFQRSLRDMIAGMRSNRNNEEKYIQSTMEDIKKELKNTDMKVKTVALQKLTYLNMLGFDMSWAAFHVVEVMSTQKLLHKVVGYQAAAQSFDENTDVMLLITNLLKKDVMSSNTAEISLGLDLLANLATLDLARDLVADVYGLLSSSSVASRKQSTLVLYRCFVRYPDALRPCFKGLVEHLDDHDQAVVCSVVSVLCELVIKHPHNYLEMAPLFYRMLLGSTNNWMTMKILKVFGALTPLEPRLTKKLVEPLKNIMSSTLAKSLLFECITTVCAGMTSNAEIVEMALEHLKDFVLDTDPNLKYLGFKALEQFVKHIPQTVLRFGNAALMCLSTTDPTIRSSALRVISGLVSKNDLKEVILRILDHISAADTAYRNELSETILSICCRDKYSLVSDFSWYLNILVELARVPGSTHGKTIAFQVTDIACRVEAMRDDAVQAVRSLLIDPSVIEMAKSGSISEVLEATAWITGEYASSVEHPKETIEALLQPGILNLPFSVQAMYVQAILKVFVHVTSNLLCITEEKKENEENGDEQQLSEEDKIKIVNELANLILAHISQYWDSPDPEVVERSCQLKVILKLTHSNDSKEEGQTEETSDLDTIKDVFSRINGIIGEELQPVSGRAQAKIVAPDDLQVVTPILEEFFDEEFDMPSEDEDNDNRSMSAGAANSSIDAATALTEATTEQKKQAKETAKNQLKQHRQRHDIFYLGGQQGQGDNDNEEEGGEGEGMSTHHSADELNVNEQQQQQQQHTNSAGEMMDVSTPTSVDQSGGSASSMDDVYKKMKKNKKKQSTPVVIKSDDDITDGAESLGNTPVKSKRGGGQQTGLDVNVFAPLEYGEELHSVEAYPTAHPQDMYSSDPPHMHQDMDHDRGDFAAPTREENTNTGSRRSKHKQRRKKNRGGGGEGEGERQEETGGEGKEQSHRSRRRKHKSKKGEEAAAPVEEGSNPAAE
jgi:AP-3 complex subunit delta-1